MTTDPTAAPHPALIAMIGGHGTPTAVAARHASRLLRWLAGTVGEYDPIGPGEIRDLADAIDAQYGTHTEETTDAT